MKSLVIKTQLMQCVFLLILAFMSRSVIAADEIEVKIWYWSGDPTILNYDISEQIELEIDNNWKYINIYPTDEPATNKHIGQIILSGDTDRNFYVILGKGVWDGEALDYHAGHDFGGITVDPEDAPDWEDYVWFEGDIAGDLTGPIRVGLMAFFGAGGSIEAPITTTAANDEDAWFYLNADNGIDLTSSQKIWTKYQDIGKVVVGNGDLKGEILAENGQIWHSAMPNTGISVDDDILTDITAGDGRIIEIIAGNIGTSLNPVTITATGTSSDDMGIGNISAGIIYADVIIDGVGERQLHLLRTTTGDFIGSIEAGNLFDEDYNGTGLAGIDIYGDLEADVTIDGSVGLPIDIGGRYVAGYTFSIGDDLKYDEVNDYWGSITIDDTGGSGDGLRGQVIINANDNSGTWESDADVTIDVETLDPVPYYDQKTTTIGVGAVGEAPFYFHATDCTPAHNGQITGASQQVTVRHYGPITYTSGMPVTIHRRLITTPVSPQSWEDVTDWYEVTSNTGTVLVIEPVTNKYWYGPYQYKIEPVLTSGDNQLRCVDVDGTPAVTEYDYQFYYTP